MKNETQDQSWTEDTPQAQEQVTSSEGPAEASNDEAPQDTIPLHSDQQDVDTASQGNTGMPQEDADPVQAEYQMVVQPKAAGTGAEEHTVRIRKSTLNLLIILCIVLIVCTAICIIRNYVWEDKYGRLIELAAAVEEDYYTDVDEDAAMDGALKGYVDGLDDPYSQYMTAEEYESYQTNNSGVTVGIGVTVSETEDGYLQIVGVTEDSPAEAAGIEVDDEIIAVDGEDVAELGYEEAVNQVRGEEGTTVTITILREDTTFDLEVTRQSIDVASCWGQMLDNNIGYIRISSFKENTPDQFEEIYEELLEEGAEGFIFDVRDDGGGLVSALEEILDPLLPEGEIAVATYKDGSTKTLVESDDESCDLPMVVLVNENTASAAELFTASLSDFNDATVVGVTTYGKGVMQVTEELPDGGALTITTATYQTTVGECYHGVGITPDEEVEIDEAYDIDYENPDVTGDAQLAAAMALFEE